MEANQALEKLFELAVRLSDKMDHGLAELGLTRARAKVLWLLHHQGAMTQHALSQALRCTPRNVTGLADALEAAGFVARGAHPTDRRATLVSLTGQGSAAVGLMHKDFGELADHLFASLADDEATTFVSALDKVLQQLGSDTIPATPAPAATYPSGALSSR